MSSDLRLAQLDEWIKETLGVSKYSLEPVSGDASFHSTTAMSPTTGARSGNPMPRAAPTPK